MKHRLPVILSVAIVVGLWLAIGILRFIFTATYDVHYHADFAVFINGEKLAFENPLYYEEVGSGCALSEDSEPEERAHLHDNIASIVHVHDRNVTWGHFFNNIDYSVGEFHLETWEGIFAENEQNRVRYILNGEEVLDVKNIVIKSEDRLLVDYSDVSDQELQIRFEQISSDAGQYNTQPDPAACKGASRSTTERLKKAFLFI